MAAAETLRIQVGVCARRHPELFACLGAVSRRGRADRLRHLALLGLSAPSRVEAEPGAVAASSRQAADPRSPPQPPDAPVSDPQLTAERARLLKALQLPD